MRRLRALLLLVPALLALVAAGAAAQAASPSRGLDPSFGNAGKTTVAVSSRQGEFPRIDGIALGPDGRLYVLERSLLLAFEASGRPAAGFGANGRLRITVGGDESQPAGLAVDSQGRVLVTGSVFRGNQQRADHRAALAPVYAAYVLRFLPSGERDITFGSDGELQTTFGLPSPAAGKGAGYKRASTFATSVVVDSIDRPIIGGGYTTAYSGCGAFAGSLDPFVARLTADGLLDTTFAGTGHALVGGHGEVSALARTPADGSATLSSGMSCGARVESEPSRFSVFTETGEPDASLDPEHPEFFMQRRMAIDPEGRILVVQIPPPAAEGPASFDRLLPSGDLDPGFGKNGRVILKGALGELGAFTVDAEGRPILSTAGNGLELRRLTADGALDSSFGPGGRLYAQAAYGQALALDGQGRIYTAGVAGGKKPKTGDRVQVARFLPGG